MPHISALSEIQGNIVEGYRLPHVAHLFGSVSARNAENWRGLLATIIDRITTASTVPGDSTLNLGLSHAALAAFEPALAHEIAPHFPAFSAGMASRAALLGDTDEFDADDWQQNHVWFSVYGQTSARLSDSLVALTSAAAGFDIALRAAGPRGEAWPDYVGGAPVRREHFGFRDDISNPALADWPYQKPRVLDEYYAGRGKYVDGKWVGIAAGEFLLGYANEAGEDPMEGLSDTARRLLEGATFGVLRQLHQDVHGFRSYLASQATPAASAAYLAARMMGRDRDGVPVGSPNAHEMRRFTYAHDEQGARCPLGAHVRRANPRESGRHRLFRRGMTYGRPLPEGDLDDGAERGLWFVGFNACIEEQFELIQAQWLNGPVGTLSAAADPISSSQLSRNLVIEGDPAARMPRLLLGIPRFVTCLGGEYYLVPSTRALTQLTRGAARRRSESTIQEAS